MKNVVVIMAGGKGERFWPMSTKNLPKQFLPLTDSPRTMIQLTVDRIKKIASEEDIYIVTNESYKNIIKEQLPELKEDQILLEPVARNTAPCIGLATMAIKKKYTDANIIVLASDHVIKNNELFLNNVEDALKKCQNNIVTLGIVPDRIETGYGYIKIGDMIDHNAYNVEQFVEKPNFETARKYYESQKYLWNSGMFVWKNSIMEELLKKHTPQLYSKLIKIYNSMNCNEYEEVLKEEYNSIESISIDYAIMEKVNNIIVIPGNFGWDDVGSWNALERLRMTDENNNITQGNVVIYNCSNNILINNNQSVISIIGLDNIVVVNNNNSLLIMNKENSADIKEMINKMKNNENEKYL